MAKLVYNRYCVMEKNYPFEDDATVRTLLESLAEGVVVCDRHCTIVLINRRTEEMFGYGATEVVGHSLNLFLPERYFGIHSGHIEEFFRNPHIRSMGRGLDLAGKRSDGTEFPVEIRVYRE